MLLLSQLHRMLPSRLFRNIGLAPPLRSLITPHASLPASLSVQLRFRLGVGASYSSSSSSHPTPSSQSAANPSLPEPSTTTTAAQGEPALTHRLQTDPLEPRKSITFTCTAPGCSTRSSHTFTTRSYEKGIVLIQCPGCKVR